MDEVLQDTFLAVWKGARRWTGQGEVAAWVWGIAVRRMVDALRRLPRPTVLLVDEGSLGTTLSAEDQVLLGVEHGDVGAAVSRLSPELRATPPPAVTAGGRSRCRC